MENLKENQVKYEDQMMFNMGQLLSVPFILLGVCLIIGVQKNISALSWAFTPGAKSDSDAELPVKKRKKKRRTS